ncbi:unnamed protein product, partial [marine sediment metagenome]
DNNSRLGTFGSFFQGTSAPESFLRVFPRKNPQRLPITGRPMNPILK